MGPDEVDVSRINGGNAVAKKFALVSFGLLCLSLAALIGFDIGSQTAEAQTPGTVTGYSMVTLDGTRVHYVVLPNGEL